MIDDQHADEDAGGVHADEDLDRAVVTALERIKLGRPEGQPGQHRRAPRRILLEDLEVRRLAALRRERGCVGEDSPKLRFLLGIEGRLRGQDRRSRHREDEDPHLHQDYSDNHSP